MAFRFRGPTWAVVAQVVVPIAIMALGAHYFVGGVEHVSQTLGIPAGLIALILAPLATELPEKFNSILWLRDNKDTLAFGNISGAMIFQSMVPVTLGLAFTPLKPGLPRRPRRRPGAGLRRRPFPDAQKPEAGPGAVSAGRGRSVRRLYRRCLSDRGYVTSESSKAACDGSVSTPARRYRTCETYIPLGTLHLGGPGHGLPAPREQLGEPGTSPPPAPPGRRDLILEQLTKTRSAGRVSWRG